MNFVSELKRRNVFKVAIMYLVVGWLLVQVGATMFETFGAPDWGAKSFTGLLALGFPIVLIFAWAFEMTPDGLKKTVDVDISQSVTGSTGQKISQKNQAQK